MNKPHYWPYIISISMLSTDGFAEGVAYLDTKPSVVNAINYDQSLNINEYYVSEKLDGIRAIWTGEQLVTRSGRVINAPDWFTHSLPSIMVEGELWAGRQQFSKVQNTVLDLMPDNEAWQEIHFNLFDAPGHLGTFDQRYEFLKRYCQSLAMRHIQCVEQFTVSSHKELDDYLERITADNAEGLMLKLKHEVYHPGRNHSLIKVKIVQDMEGLVVGYKEGKGKYQGKMGALLIELRDGARFYVGSGFSDIERTNPPKIGTTITFKHNGWTVNGLPRFARFFRVREPE